jgi:hypothetical protein
MVTDCRFDLALKVVAGVGGSRSGRCAASGELVMGMWQEIHVPGVRACLNAADVRWPVHPAADGGAPSLKLWPDL